MVTRKKVGQVTVEEKKKYSSFLNAVTASMSLHV